MNKGFIAITVTLSVAGILLALVAVSSIESAAFFDQAMKKVYREMNYHYAYDCIDQAVLGLVHDYFWVTDDAKEIPELHCSIVSITKQNNQRIIKTRGDFQHAYVYRSALVELTTQDVKVIKIE